MLIQKWQVCLAAHMGIETPCCSLTTQIRIYFAYLSCTDASSLSPVYNRVHMKTHTHTHTQTAVWSYALVKKANELKKWKKKTY